MNEIWIEIAGFFTVDRLLVLIRTATILIVGLLLARTVGAALGRLVARKANAQRAMLTRRVMFYALAALVVLTTLRSLGFEIDVLLGAAGVLTVAMGFASQTSASNLISGFFLIGEQPFVIGDVIKVGDTLGEVIAIDLISLKLRTFDNLLVRIPNETLLKSEITNLTHFPIRRIDIPIGVAYKEDISKVHEVLMAVADRNPLCLDEPKPLFIFKGYGDSALELQFSPWTARANFLDLLNSIKHEIKEAFDAAGIEIPFPHRTLYAGSVTEPFPVRVVPDPSEP